MSGPYTNTHTHTHARRHTLSHIHTNTCMKYIHTLTKNTLAHTPWIVIKSQHWNKCGYNRQQPRAYGFPSHCSPLSILLTLTLRGCQPAWLSRMPCIGLTSNPCLKCHCTHVDLTLSLRFSWTKDSLTNSEMHFVLCKRFKQDRRASNSIHEIFREIFGECCTFYSDCGCCGVVWLYTAAEEVA